MIFYKSSLFLHVEGIIDLSKVLNINLILDEQSP